MSTKFNKRFILAIQTQRETKISSALKPRSWPLIFGLSFFALERSLSQDITNTYKYINTKKTKHDKRGVKLESFIVSAKVTAAHLHSIDVGLLECFSPCPAWGHHTLKTYGGPTVSYSISISIHAMHCYSMLFHVPNLSRPVLQIYANLCKSQLFSPAFHLRQAPELNWPGEAKTVQWKGHRTQQTDANEVVET